MTTNTLDDDLDTPIYGAEAIARAAGLVDDQGNVNFRRIYYALEHRLIDAGKFGKLWCSTKRRARRHATCGEVA
jgi:hypothetical protein